MKGSEKLQPRAIILKVSPLEKGTGITAVDSARAKIYAAESPELTAQLEEIAKKNKITLEQAREEFYGGGAI